VNYSKSIINIITVHNTKKIKRTPKYLTSRKKFCISNTRWFKYDRDICGLFTQKSVPVIF